MQKSENTAELEIISFFLTAHNLNNFKLNCNYLYSNIEQSEYSIIVDVLVSKETYEHTCINCYAAQTLHYLRSKAPDTKVKYINFTFKESNIEQIY